MTLSGSWRRKRKRKSVVKDTETIESPSIDPDTIEVRDTTILMRMKTGIDRSAEDSQRMAMIEMSADTDTSIGIEATADMRQGRKRRRNHRRSSLIWAN